MKILCAVEDKERQGWALAFEGQGHSFSFFNEKLSIHHVCQLYKPDILLHKQRPLAKYAQNACYRYNCVPIDVEQHKIPICANTYLFKRVPADKQEYIAIFGDPTDLSVKLISKLVEKHKVRVFSDQKWPLSEYCGFVNPTTFSRICNEASACIVSHYKPHVDHYNVVAAGGNLLSFVENLEIGTPILTAADVPAIINSRSSYIKQLSDHSFVVGSRSCNIIPGFILDIYEKEIRNNLRGTGKVKPDARSQPILAEVS